MTTAEPPGPVATPRHAGLAPQIGGRRRREPARLNQPWRGLVALGELVLATVAVLVGIACWHRAAGTMLTPLANGLPPLRSTILHGNWLSGAIGLVTLAGFLVLDALRQTALAIRTRNRPQPAPIPLVDTDA